MFQDLLQYWHTNEAKAISHSNKDNLLMLDYMHTLGRKSYAILRHELSAESQEDGNVCNDPYNEVIPPPRRKSRVHLYGSGVKKSDLKNKDTKSSFILPKEFMQLTPHDASSAPNRNTAQSGQSSKSFNQDFFNCGGVGVYWKLRPYSIHIVMEFQA
uniref:Uncharacterized protein n=1 Tax=Chenopodium quinoa TaxID=63459 RepID=A0A803N891_CHEQI